MQQQAIDRYTSPKRYYRTNDGRNWIEHNVADRTVTA